jgi:hypothetical protein
MGETAVARRGARAGAAAACPDWTSGQAGIVAVASGSAQRWHWVGTVGPHVGRPVDKATLLQKRGPFSPLLIWTTIVSSSPSGVSVDLYRISVSESDTKYVSLLYKICQI